MDAIVKQEHQVAAIITGDLGRNGKRTATDRLVLQVALLTKESFFSRACAPFEMEGAVTEKRIFQVWRTITLGEYPDYGAYKSALERNGSIRIADAADEILSKMRSSEVKMEVDLVLVYAGREGFNGDLGFRQSVMRSEFYDRARTLGLEFCPLEVAPALRLAYQLRGISREGTLIAMEPMIVGKPPMPHVLSLYNDAGPSLWINGWPVDRPQYADWTLRTEWVFVQPRRS